MLLKDASYHDVIRAGIATAVQRARLVLAEGDSSRFSDALLELAPRQQALAFAEAGVAAQLLTIEQLSARVRTIWHEDPVWACRLAEVLVRCTRLVRGPEVPKALRADRLATAWSLRANCLRLAGDYRGAARAWRRARILLDRGTGDPQLLAEAARLQALLYQAQRRFDEARDLLQLSLRQAEITGDEDARCRALWARADLAFREGRTQQAYDGALEVLSRTNSQAAPIRVLAAKHLLTFTLLDLGETNAAISWYRTYRDMYSIGGDMIQIRARWLEGRLLVARKDWTEAVKAFDAVRLAFLEKRLEFDAALVSIELALCHAKRGHFSLVTELCKEMYPVFCSMKIPQEASATLILFADAALGNLMRRVSVLELEDELKTLARSFGR